MELKAKQSEVKVIVPTHKVSCLGPEGSYSERAASELCAGYELVLCRRFSEVVQKLVDDEVDYAVLPVENSLSGGVLESLDLLENEDIFGTAELLLPIDHRLALLEGVNEGEIKNIYSHVQAISQCIGYLTKHFPNAEYIPTFSTADSLKKIDACSAGIVGAHVHREGLVLSNENIADLKGNFTRFLRVEKRKEIPQHSIMVFFCAVCPDRPGALIGLLKILFNYGLNLTRIESRPVKNAFGHYRFFIEFVGNVGSDRVKKALADIEAYSAAFKLLGAYN